MCQVAHRVLHVVEFVAPERRREHSQRHARCDLLSAIRQALCEALTMVSELNASGGGLEPEVGAFARHVDSDQNIEIARMQELEEGDAGLAAARRAGPSPAVRERAKRLSYAGGSPALCYVG